MTVATLTRICPCPGLGRHLSTSDTPGYWGSGSRTDRDWTDAAATAVLWARLTTLLLRGIVGTELNHACSLAGRSVRVEADYTKAPSAAQHLQHCVMNAPFVSDGPGTPASADHSPVLGLN